jgi:hypothetical protein
MLINIKYLLLVCIFILNGSLLNFRHSRVMLFHFQKNVGDTIRWSAGRQLTFDDFQATPKPSNNQSSDTLAVCSCSIEYTLKIVDGKIKIYAFAVFSQKRSWMIRKTDFILQHEQGHFDIAEIYALRFQKNVNSSDIKNAHAFFEFLNSNLQQIVIECNVEQEKYDSWTSNSLGREPYYKWIREQLDSLGAYK